MRGDGGCFPQRDEHGQQQDVRHRAQYWVLDGQPYHGVKKTTSGITASSSGAAGSTGRRRASSGTTISNAYTENRAGAYTAGQPIAAATSPPRPKPKNAGGAPRRPPLPAPTGP